jgi:hypothetical protein
MSPALVLWLLFPGGPAADVSADIAKLSHVRFAVREAAQKRLVEVGRAALPSLRSVNAADAETAARVAAAVAAILDAEVETLRPLPELDSIWWDGQTQWYRESLAPPGMLARISALGRDGPPYANFFAATEGWVRDCLGAGMSPWVLRMFLAEMRRKDGQFLQMRAGCPAPVDPEAYLRGFAR